MGQFSRRSQDRKFVQQVRRSSCELKSARQKAACAADRFHDGGRVLQKPDSPRQARASGEQELNRVRMEVRSVALQK